jgi:predicted RNA binding protein YcfA (HicA-like mRNA interferase family)
MKHPSLQQEGRKQIKVIYLNPENDLPIKTLHEIVKLAKKLY